MNFYKRKHRYGAMDLSGAGRLKHHEGENARLKRLVAGVMPDDVMLKKAVGKPLTTPATRRDRLRRAARDEAGERHRSIRPGDADLTAPGLRSGGEP